MTACWAKRSARRRFRWCAATSPRSIPIRNAQRIPINMMSAALGLAGFANLTTDDDDFVRRQELIEAPSANPADPPPAHSLAMRVAEKYVGSDAELQNGKLVFQGHTIPISPDRSIAINYAGPPDTFPSVSLADFESCRQGRKHGSAAEVGEWQNRAGGYRCRRRPFRHAVLSRSSADPNGLTPGVEIHANTVRTLLTRSYLVPAPQWGLALALLLATSADGVGSSPRSRPAAP